MAPRPLCKNSHASAPLRRVLDTIARDRFSGGEAGLFAPILASLLEHGDRYFVLADFDAYAATQARVAALADGEGVVILCGRFEGVDERLIAGRALEEISIGDYVLAGGELAAMALMEACVRLLPGVMGREESGADESFSHGLLEYPQYTRPQVFEGLGIPEVLTSGDHARIAAFRRAEAERQMAMIRAELDQDAAI